jgi:hypothetical protein
MHQPGELDSKFQYMGHLIIQRQVDNREVSSNVVTWRHTTIAFVSFWALRYHRDILQLRNVGYVSPPEVLCRIRTVPH